MNTNREKLINWIRNTYVSNSYYTYKATMDETADAVIADMLIDNGVVMREKGEWIEGKKETLFRKQGNYICSNCESHTGIVKFNFCPNCGADMRKDKTDE